MSQPIVALSRQVLSRDQAVFALLQGQEKFFLEVGVPVATRITPPPKLSEKDQAAFIQKVKALAPKYRTELLREA